MKCQGGSVSGREGAKERVCQAGGVSGRECVRKGVCQEGSGNREGVKKAVWA